MSTAESRRDLAERPRRRDRVAAPASVATDDPRRTSVGRRVWRYTWISLAVVSVVAVGLVAATVVLCVLLVVGGVRLKRWLDGADDQPVYAERRSRPVYHAPVQYDSGPSMQEALAAALRQDREEQERRASYRGPYRW